VDWGQYSYLQYYVLKLKVSLMKLITDKSFNLKYLLNLISMLEQEAFSLPRCIITYFAHYVH